MSETIKLGDKDSAIVIRSDGKRELYLCRDADEHNIAGIGSSMIAIVAMALNDEECFNYLQQKFDNELAELNEKH